LTSRVYLKFMRASGRRRPRRARFCGKEPDNGQLIAVPVAPLNFLPQFYVLTTLNRQREVFFHHLQLPDVG
jgi:hypothetical protein